MAASRCGKVFSKSPKNQAVQTKKSSRTRQTKNDANKIAKQQKDEVLTDKEKQDMMLEWAMNGFKPSGPKGFAPTEGNGNTCALLRATRGAHNPKLQVVITHALHVCSQHSFGLH